MDGRSAVPLTLVAQAHAEGSRPDGRPAPITAAEVPTPQGPEITVITPLPRGDLQGGIMMYYDYYDPDFGRLSEAASVKDLGKRRSRIEVVGDTCIVKCIQ